jgi:hypothetical protein
MKRICLCWLLIAASARADDALDAMKQQMQQLQQQMQELQEKMRALETSRTAAPPAAVAEAAPTSPPPVNTQSAWSPTQPFTLMSTPGGQAYMNMSFIADMVVGSSTDPNPEQLFSAHHDPHERGFNLTAAELTLDGAVDPYFKGQATLTMVLEPSGDTVTELEEAWLKTTTLPFELQLQAGQFFANFGRLNAQHPHTWDFVTAPIVLTRMFGDDGLRNPGAQLSWLAPTPFYTELMLGVFNGGGSTAYSFRSDSGTTDIAGGNPNDPGVASLSDMLYVPRLVTSFDLTDQQTLMLGASGALGANSSGPDGWTSIAGGDAYWKWRPVNAQQGWPFVSAQSEVMYRWYKAAQRISSEDDVTVLPEDTFRSWGMYAQLLWGFHLRWVAGLRGEYVSGDSGSFDDNLRCDRTRVTPDLTFFPTEFSKFRLEYDYDHRTGLGDDHSVWLQVEFVLGAHGAHKF